MNKKNALRLVFACYAVAILAVLLVSLFNFLFDTMLFATNQIQTTQISTSQMVLQDFVLEEDASITSTSQDPQILMENYNHSAVKLVMDMKCSKFPGEVTIYYKRNASDPYSTNQKIYAKQNSNGEYEFIMPRGNIASIRVDPTNFTDVNIKFNKFTLNPKRSFLSYFGYNGEVIFNLAIWPSLVAAVLAWIIQAYCSTGKTFNFVKRKKNDNK